MDYRQNVTSFKIAVSVQNNITSTYYTFMNTYLESCENIAKKLLHATLCFSVNMLVQT